MAPDDSTPKQPRLIAEGPFFAQLWESVLYDPNLKSTDKVVYAVLQRYAMQFGADSVFPSQETIANKIHMNREAVNVALQNLAAHGHISRERQGNVWVVTVHSPVGKPDKHVGKPDKQVLENPTSTVGKPDTIRETQSNRDTETPSLSPPREKKRGSRLPDDWEPDESLKAWALDDLGVSEDYLTYQTDQFCDYWHAKAGQQAIKLDWDLTFRSWMRKAKEEYGGKRSSSNGRALNNDEKRPIPSGLPDVLQEPRREMSPEKLAELRALRGKS